MVRLYSHQLMSIQFSHTIIVTWKEKDRMTSVWLQFPLSLLLSLFSYHFISLFSHPKCTLEKRKEEEKDWMESSSLPLTLSLQWEDWIESRERDESSSLSHTQPFIQSILMGSTFFLLFPRVDSWSKLEVILQSITSSSYESVARYFLLLSLHLTSFLFSTHTTFQWCEQQKVNCE